MSVPDSRCVRVVTPDDHVNIGFHEILIHDLEEEELPFVAMSELGCLRLDWPMTLFTFMSRYQFDLDESNESRLTDANSDQVLSDEDLPAAAGSEDRRQVIRICNVSPDVQAVDISQVGRDWDSRRTLWGARHPKHCPGKRMQRSACAPATTTKVRAKDDTPGLAASDPSPVVGTVDMPEVGRVETIQLSSPPRSGQLSPESPRTIAFEDLGDSSVPLSPNRVQAGRSQEVPEDGSLFNVSPVSPGFLMLPSGAAVQQPEAGLHWP